MGGHDSDGAAQPGVAGRSDETLHPGSDTYGRQGDRAAPRANSMISFSIPDMVFVIVKAIIHRVTNMNNQAEGNGLARQIEMISEEVFKHLSNSQHRERESQGRLEKKDRQLRKLVDHIGLLESQLSDYKHREQELQVRVEEKNRRLINLEDRFEAQYRMSDSQHREQELQARLEEKDRQLRKLADHIGLQESRLSDSQHREQESQGWLEDRDRQLRILMEHIGLLESQLSDSQHREQESQARLEEKDRQLGVLEDNIELKESEQEKMDQGSYVLSDMLLEIVLSQKSLLDEISQKLGYPMRRETCSLRNKVNICRYSPDNDAVLKSVGKPGNASIQPNLHSKSESYFHSARRTAERYAAARKLSQRAYLPHGDTGIIFVRGPVEALDSELLYDTFSAFGDILSCRVATYSDCSDPAGFACVCYEEIEAAEEAFQQGVDGMLLNDELVFVELCMPGHPPCLSSITSELCQIESQNDQGCTGSTPESCDVQSEWSTEEWDSEAPCSTDDESCLSPTQNL